MVSQKSKDYILNFIRKTDRPTKNDVIKYMSSKKVPEKIFRTSRMTTIGIIRELEESGRIKVEGVEGWRPGQSHYLVANDDNYYRWLNDQIENIGSMLRHHPETKERMLNLLIISLQRANKFIKNENDKQTLIQRIIGELLKIRYDKDFVDEIDRLYFDA